MGGELEVGELGRRYGVDDGKPAAAIADDDMTVSRVDPDIVGVAVQRDLAGGERSPARNKRTVPSPALVTTIRSDAGT